jgi:predicted RNA-binding Zn ribbon-like protein
MKKTPTAASAAPRLPFLHIGGDPSLDLVNTVDWTRRGPENDRLTDYDGLTRWAEGAGLVARAVAARLRRAAAARPRQAESAYRASLRLRWVLHRLAEAFAAGKAAGAEIDEFNTLLASALRRLRLARVQPVRGVGKLAEWEWCDAAECLDSPLWLTLWSAAKLFTSDEARRIRVCAGPDCGWVYVDRSRNGLRRWCQMATCGTQAKSLRRTERRRSDRKFVSR